MSGQGSGPRRHEHYTVAFFCALSLEMSAVRYLLDREHQTLQTQPGDSNRYIFGELSGHNVVIAWLSYHQGKGAAATVATNVHRSFPSIQHRFLVSIGGGVPSQKHDIRLGDVVIGIPDGQHGGVVQYDLGKDEVGEFKLKGFLMPTPAALRNATEIMQSNHLAADSRIEEFLGQMLQTQERLLIFQRPAPETDILFAADCDHAAGRDTCEDCDERKIVVRSPRKFERPEIHYGLIASGDSVMRSATKRQEIVRRVGNILCFEMEAAGIATDHTCIVIRGISDYADSHKNDSWQYYAAAAAAATAKELLSYVSCSSHQQAQLPSPDPAILQQSQECAISLSFLEMNDRPNDANITAADGTCKWLLWHDVCYDWSTQDQGLLWIKGKPGSGKSTLLRYFMDVISNANHKQNKAFVLSFFLHGRGVELQKTPLGLFRSLLYQVLSQDPEAAPELLNTFKKRCATMGKCGQDWHWRLRELQDAFRASIRKILQRQTVWLFIDALDECGKHNAIDLVRHFKSLLASVCSGTSQFLICFTCRHYPILSLDFKYEITLEDENMGDVATYVSDRFSSLEANVACSLTNLITARANGVFMWALLQVEKALELEFDGASVSRIEAEILSIPPDLHSLYMGLVQSMNERANSRKMMELICFVRRPLTLEELPWAMALDPSHKSAMTSLEQIQSSDDFIGDSARMERRLKALSCGLAEAVATSDGRVVQFIHQSVRDFFVERGLAALADYSEISNISKLLIGRAHYQIARTCLQYCLVEEIAVSKAEREDWLSQFPFIHYAVKYWVEHAQESETNGISQEDILIRFDWPSPALFQRWLGVSSRINDSSVDLAHGMRNMLHLLSQNELLSVLEPLLRNMTGSDVDIDARDASGRTPLLWAARNGNVATVELLLKHGRVNVNSKETSGWTPLFWAVANRHKSVAEVLLATRQVDVDLHSLSGRTPLSWAAQKGYSAGVDLLLTVGGANPDKADAEGRTPLWYAADSNIAKQLIDKGASISRTGHDGWTPLHRASSDGRTDFVKLLINNKADIEAKDSWGLTPLCVAAREGHSQVIEILLAEGADIEAAGKDEKTSLFLASENSCCSAIKTLLNRGAKMEKTVGYRRITPLFAAYNSPRGGGAFMLLLDKSTSFGDEKNWWKLLKLAIDNKGDEIVGDALKKWPKLDPPAIEGGMLLFLAAFKGYAESVRLLLDKGINIEAATLHLSSSQSRVKMLSGSLLIEMETQQRCTPLHLAAEYNWFEVAEVLLERGATVDAIKTDRFTPLHLACRAGSRNTVKLLLQYGANINAKSESGYSPLHLSSYNNFKEITEALLADGADTEAIHESGRTPLHAAACNNHVEAIQLLLNSGAKIEAIDKAQQTPLHLAAESGCAEASDILLQNGADATATNASGQTPLHGASCNNHAEVIKLLLKVGAKIDATDKTLQTPLHLAAESRGSGAPNLFNLQDEAEAVWRRRAILTLEAWKGGAKALRTLLENAVNIEAMDASKQTPLHKACIGGYLENVRVLIEAGANVNAVDDRNSTPLELATMKGRTEIIRGLLDYVAKIESTDDMQFTPLQRRRLLRTRRRLKAPRTRRFKISLTALRRTRNR